MSSMKKEYVTVILSARNEEKNIKKVIDLLNELKNDIIDEIVVIDNGSTDKTYQIAKSTGVTVLKCEKQGKGYAMECGINYAKNGILVFLDSDVNNYSKDIVLKLINPILEGRANFVKSMFEREGGRVTELVAKPLLEILFPEIHKFSQPLSGMIAGEKIFFEKIQLEKDYGVDIGILLDMIELNAKIEEVYVGKINNDSQPWIKLQKMSKEVITAILKRANIVSKK